MKNLMKLHGLFNRVIESKDLLKKAVKWSRKAVRLENNYFNNDTLAALYFKLGKKNKATKKAQKAIKLAKKSGDDYSETEHMLERISKL